MPPYSSITSARWVCVVCIFSSRSSTGIDGGTNSSVALELRRSSRAFQRKLPSRCARDQRQHVLDVDEAGRDRRASRDRPAGANAAPRGTARRNRAASVSSSTATMSARGTITSLTRSSPNLQQVGEHLRSCAESARALPLAFLDHLFEALAHLRRPRPVAAHAAAPGASAAMAALSSSSRRWASVIGSRHAALPRIGIGDAELAQDRGLQRLHDCARRARSRDRSPADAARRARPDASHDRQSSCRAARASLRVTP